MTRCAVLKFQHHHYRPSATRHSLDDSRSARDSVAFASATTLSRLFLDTANLICGPKRSVSFQAVLSDVDGGSGKAEKQQTEGSLANFCATPRAAKIAELTAEAIGNAEFSRLITRGQGPATTDCLHLALQALQWHLALAMVRTCTAKMECSSRAWSPPPMSRLYHGMLVGSRRTVLWRSSSLMSIGAPCCR